MDVLVLVNSTMLAAGQVCRGSTGWLVGVEARNKRPWAARRGNRQAKRSDRLRVVLVARIVKKEEEVLPCRRSLIGDVI